MGQQQLLLIVLVAILIGIATFVALNILGLGSKESNLTAVRQDIAHIATSAQTWQARPVFMGGGNNMFTNISFSNIPFHGEIVEGSNGLISVNMNGTYWFREIHSNEVYLRGYPSTENGYIAGATPSLGWFEARITRNSFEVGSDLDVQP